MNKTSKILVVDDEPDNLIILENYLKDAMYDVDTARHGEQAWMMLNDNPNKYDIVLLDWMMPGQSGLEILQLMQKHPMLRHIQVIMQTARARAEEIQEGINAGAWYYLTKPFEEETLLAIVKTALIDRQNYLDMKYAIINSTASMSNGKRFVIRTLPEAKNLATLLAKFCPNPENRGIGFLEILINSIEHGNLGITYAEKTKLRENDLWEEEVERLLALPEMSQKVVEVMIDREETGISFRVKDQGQGFAWQQYLHFDPDRATHLHGRGIAMANLMSFDHLEYCGNGNEVVLFVKNPC